MFYFQKIVLMISRFFTDLTDIIVRAWRTVISGPYDRLGTAFVASKSVMNFRKIILFFLLLLATHKFCHLKVYYLVNKSYNSIIICQKSFTLTSRAFLVISITIYANINWVICTNYFWFLLWLFNFLLNFLSLWFLFL